MRSRVVAGLIGVGLAVSAVAAPSASAAPAAAAPLPAVGSWPIGWSAAVIRAAEGDELRLLDPSGQPYTVADVPAGSEIVDVRHDARRVITKSADGEGDRVVFRIWDVATKKSWKLTLHKSTDLYFGPGDQLLSVYASPTQSTILRSAAGSPMRTLRHPGADWYGGVSPGGTAMYAAMGDGLFVISVRADRTERAYLLNGNALPPEECQAGGVWTDGTMRFGCTEGLSPASYYKENLVSETRTRLLPNIVDAWAGFATDPPTGMGRFDSCDDGGFVAMDHGDRAEPVRPQGPWGAGQIDYRAIAGRGTSLWLTVKWSCDEDEQRTSLVRFDTKTKVTTTVAGPTADTVVGSVRSAQTLDGLT